MTILLVVGGLILVYLLHGAALYHLWGWFLVPLGLPAVSVPWGIGIGLVVSYLTHHEIPKKGEETETVALWTSAFFRPLLALAVGWFIHRFWGPFG